MKDELDFNTVLNRILENLMQAVPFSSATVFLLRGNHMRAVAAFGLPDIGSVLSQKYPTDDELCQRMVLTRKPVVLQDAKHSLDFNRWGATKYVRGWMGVPLIIRHEVVGFLTLDSLDVGAYGDRDAQIAQAFANQAAITIDNVQLYDQTQRLLKTTKKQAEDLQLIMDIVPDGIVLLDQNLTITTANRAALSYLSHFSDVAVGSRMERIGNLQLISLLNKSASVPSWREITTHDEKHIFEISARKLAGIGSMKDYLVILRNVTEQRKEEDYLKAQERLATVGQLAAGIAHDFNNIMAVITLYTQLTMHSPNLPEKDARRLATVQQEAQRAADLIRQILDFSRQSVLERKPMDLLPFLKDFVSALKFSLPNTVEISLSSDEGEFLVIADPNRIEQALTNLAYNAREAMPEGGSIVIGLSSITLLPSDSFPLPDMRSGTWHVVKVNDSGMGFPREDLSHLFEPFFETRPLGKRTGLGLAQVYGIVKQHDGFIDVDSQVGVGTNFSIFLPAFITDEPITETLDLAAMEHGQGQRILIVEDEYATRQALAEIVELLNYESHTAGDGFEALERFDEMEGQVDLVISDMIMPKMNGSELFQALKERQPNIKMILITGYPLDSSGQEIISQGVVDYIQKPVQIQDVAAAIKKAIDQGI